MSREANSSIDSKMQDDCAPVGPPQEAMTRLTPVENQSLTASRRTAPEM